MAADWLAEEPSEADCREYLRQLRWPDGFICPRCAGRTGWPIRDGWLIECSRCGHQASLAAGTIFAGSKMPITHWFRVAWVMAEHPEPVTVGVLQKVVGFASYQTAWAWMHKLRRVMRPKEDETLSGKIEAGVRVLNLGGKARELAGTGRFEFRAALGYSDDGAITGVRIERISDGPDDLDGFIRRVVAPSSEVLKVWTGDSPASVWPASPGKGLGLVAESLRAWLSHWHLAYVSPKHFDGYVDEFVFKCPQVIQQPGGRFELLLRRAVGVAPLPYRELVGRDLMAGMSASKGSPDHQRSSGRPSS